MKECPNCEKELYENVRDTEGHGAGAGQIIDARRLCKCNEGCYTYEKDDIPGFRSRDIGHCCKCGELGQ